MENLREDRDWLRAYFKTESDFVGLEFIQAFIYLILYYFFLGYGTNALIYPYGEEAKPKKLSKLYGYRGLIRLKANNPPKGLEI